MGFSESEIPSFLTLKTFNLHAKLLSPDTDLKDLEQGGGAFYVECREGRSLFLF